MGIVATVPLPSFKGKDFQEGDPAFILGTKKRHHSPESWGLMAVIRPRSVMELFFGLGLGEDPEVGDIVVLPPVEVALVEGSPSEFDFAVL